MSRANQVNNYNITDFCNNIDECDESLAEKLENFNDAVTSLLGWRDRLDRFFEYINIKLWICIFLIGILSCFVAIFADSLSSILFASRMSFIRGYERFDLQIGLWVITSIVLALLSTFICDMISVYAQGSGVPEVKTILSGINFYKYLSLETLVAKVLGMITIQAAGFLIGFQGPIIHCSAIIANSLMKVKYFKEFGETKFTRRQLLITSVACGVVCTFGAPYGGILISVELCASVYLLSNLFKAYVCGTVAFFVYQQFHMYEGYFDDYKKEPLINKYTDSTFHFIILGIIVGYLGSFLVFLSGKLIEMKNSSQVEFLKK